MNGLPAKEWIPDQVRNDRKKERVGWQGMTGDGVDVNDLKLNLDQYLKPEVNSFGGLIEFIMKNLMFFGGILMVFAVLYTGIMFITAGGDMQKAAKARANLIMAITGLVIILLAESIAFWIPMILFKGKLD